jgi:glycosyltransferase involved in cell wall biosynthesis
MPPYDIVILLRVNAFGGSERHTIDLVNHLVASGRRVAFVQSGVDLVERGIDLAGRGIDVSAKNLEVIHTPLPVRDLSRCDYRAWLRLLRRLPADRVLFVKPWYYAGHVPLLKALRRCYPIVYYIEHSMPEPLEPRTRRRHFGLLPGLGLWWYRERRFRRRVSRLVDHVLAVSETQRKALIAEAFFREDQVTTCPNGIDLAYWQRDQQAGEAFRRRLKIPDDWYLFGYVGRLSELKRVDVAIRALGSLVQQGDERVGLCIVGDGDQRNTLEPLASHLGVGDRVFFVGPLKDVRPAYSAMQTLLLPSRMESFGLVLVEAMACGCRVTASDVGGVGEVVSEPTAGTLLASGDPDDWAQAMQRYLQSSADEYEELAKSVRGFVERTHAKQSRMQHLEKTLFSLG